MILWYDTLVLYDLQRVLVLYEHQRENSWCSVQARVALYAQPDPPSKRSVPARTYLKKSLQSWMELKYLSFTLRAHLALALSLLHTHTPQNTLILANLQHTDKRLFHSLLAHVWASILAQQLCFCRIKAFTFHPLPRDIVWNSSCAWIFSLHCSNVKVSRRGVDGVSRPSLLRAAYCSLPRSANCVNAPLPSYIQISKAQQHHGCVASAVWCANRKHRASWWGWGGVRQPLFAYLCKPILLLIPSSVTL